MQHNKHIALRQMAISVCLGVTALIATSVAQAETPKVISTKVEGTAVAASGAQIKPGQLPTAGKTAAGAAIGKQGDNQYPGTTPIPLPKPRKDALEAAGALKSKAAQ